MRKVGTLAAVLFTVANAASGSDLVKEVDATAVPADFKLIVAFYGLGKEPLQKVELVFTKGRAYRFVEEPGLEVVIHEPRSSRLDLLDLARKIRSEVTLKKLETFRANLHDAIAASCAKREASGSRADEVAAAMSRALIDPRLTRTYDERTHLLRLTSGTVEVDARGEPEPDGARLSLIASTLDALIGLESLRAPQGIATSQSR